MRSRLRNKCWVQPSTENKTAYKKQRNKCVEIIRKSTKRYMDNTSQSHLTKTFRILLYPSWQIKVWLLPMA